MGYRSEVIALIYPDIDDSAGETERGEKLYTQLKLLMATTFKDLLGGEEMDFGTYMSWEDAEGVLKFNLEDVKWYESYPDVQAFMEMLRAFDGNADEPIEGYCTEFIRLGEESDDTDVRSTGENIRYYLQVCRSISCNI